MQQEEKKTPEGVISIEEYLKKRKRINKEDRGRQWGKTEKMQSSAFLLAELYM